MNITFDGAVYLITGRGSSRTEREIMCSSKSISQSEFYAEDRAEGLKPAICLIVRSAEYSGEKYCRYGNIVYSIYRTYDPRKGFTELYLKPRAGEQSGG